MLRKITAVWVLGILIMPVISISAAADLTEEQKKIQAEIEHSLMAPCCWNMTLDHHKTSEVARKLSQDIGQMVAAGKSRGEILDYYSSPEQYGERILSTPSQKNLLGKMAYWLIPIAFGFGGIVVYLTVRRLTQKAIRQAKKSEGGKKPAAQRPKSGADDSYWDELLEKELKQLD